MTFTFVTGLKQMLFLRNDSRRFFSPQDVYDTLSARLTAERRLTEGRERSVWYIRMLRPGAEFPFASYWTTDLQPPAPTTGHTCHHSTGILARARVNAHRPVGCLTNECNISFAAVQRRSLHWRTTSVLPIL